MKVLMIGVDKKSVGGMLTVINNFLNSEKFVKSTNLDYVATVSRKNVLFKIVKFLFAYIKILFKLIFCKVDIVHVHMAERGSVLREGFVVKTANFFNKKTIIHLHAAEIEKWYLTLSSRKQKRVEDTFKCADKILILGKNWEKFMISLVGENNIKKIDILYNAVNVPNKNYYNIDSNFILFYGMLIDRKGIKDVFQSFDNAKKYIDSKIKLLIYGDDVENQINSLLSQYNNDKRIVYKGWLDKKDFPEVARNTILHLLPSFNEGLPMSILETMSYGIPNISTNIAAIPEAISSKEGILINPGDCDSLTSAIVKICNDYSLRKYLSNNSYLKVRQLFSIESQVNKLLNIYEEMLK